MLTDSVYLALASSFVFCLQLPSSEPGSEANQDPNGTFAFHGALQGRLGRAAVWALVINDVGLSPLCKAEEGRKEGRTLNRRGCPRAGPLHFRSPWEGS